MNYKIIKQNKRIVNDLNRMKQFQREILTRKVVLHLRFFRLLNRFNE